jgi:transcriptional regulator with XRE-family HTH domain
MRYRVRYTLKQWRQLADMTQTELAEACNTNKDTVSRWERGAQQPRADEISLIEKALSIKWSDDISDAKVVTKSGNNE